MAIYLNPTLQPKDLLPSIDRLFQLSAAKVRSIERSWKPSAGTPVFTVDGVYTSRGWTEWTQGFQYGSAILQFDATGDKWFLDHGRKMTLERMAPHVSHIGVHDHGFNNVSTYGNLLRLMRSGRIAHHSSEAGIYEMALKVSGAVQAARWTPISNGKGYIYSFNGPQSLFIDTVRSLRSLAVAHQLGHVLMGERDVKISLLERLLEHAETTATFSVYYGQGRDSYDVAGRVTHECIFNLNDGNFRCPNSQQGYSPFTTWTRGLAWALCGFAEELEFLLTVPSSAPELQRRKGLKHVLGTLLKPALATAGFYLKYTPVCGVPYWDTGAPNLHKLGDYLNRPADPYNPHEPVDSSAAAIAAQGLLRLSRFLARVPKAALPISPSKANSLSQTYRSAALTIAKTLFSEPYLSTSPRHQGLLLHSVYHRPNGWDSIPNGQTIPNGESSMWGDYHARELALILMRDAKRQPWPDFYGCIA